MDDYTLDDLLNGEVNVDHEGNVRWRVTFHDPNKIPMYFERDELENVFIDAMRNMERCMDELDKPR